MCSEMDRGKIKSYKKSRENNEETEEKERNRLKRGFVKFQRTCGFDTSAMKGMKAQPKCRLHETDAHGGIGGPLRAAPAVEIRPGSNDQIVGLQKAIFSNPGPEMLKMSSALWNGRTTKRELFFAFWEKSKHDLSNWQRERGGTLMANFVKKHRFANICLQKQSSCPDCDNEDAATC